MYDIRGSDRGSDKVGGLGKVYKGEVGGLGKVYGGCMEECMYDKGVIGWGDKGMIGGDKASQLR